MFTYAYLSFFRDLSDNNTTAWFNEHKKTYEKEVKKPFGDFVEKLITHIHQITPSILITPGEAIFRINRDIRFSEDKSPYKTEMSAAISRSGKKGNTCPGLYMRLGAQKATVGCGAMSLEKSQLLDIRHHIANNPEVFEAIIGNKDFKAVFGTVQGEKNKRLPEELQKAAEKQPLIYNTSFYITTDLAATEIVKADFFDQVMGLYQRMLPFGLFFEKLVKTSQDEKR